MRRIGIDVGGTNTDAVLIEEGKVRAAVKAPTTPGRDRRHPRRARPPRRRPAPLGGQAHRRRDDRHHAFHQRRRAAALLEPGRRAPHRPAGRAPALPPFCDWPADLAAVVEGEVAMVEGGHEYDGRAFMPLDRVALSRRRRGEMRRQGHPLGRDLRDLLAARSRPRARGGGDRRRGDPRLPPSPARPTSAGSACSSARTRRCSTPRSPILPRDHGRGVRAGDRRFRHFGAALHHPERRHGGRGRPGACGCRSIPSPPGRRTRCAAPPTSRGLPTPWWRCRRHHDRCRADQERLPARGERGREDRRRAHAVPDAGPVLVRARRRQPRLARSGRRSGRCRSATA